LHDNVDTPVAPSVTLEVSSVQAKPVVGDTSRTILTVPVKPFTGLIVIADLISRVPALTVTDAGLTDTVKSRTLYTIVTE
jgi:hypothetical protein